ncbi:DNA-directed RNA polymerase subunit beta [Staphylococcus felis]|nr:DNA-directed RNA polymerase subunit beta [Staphylococcus felis]AVP35471.1 hypothetical protein C7J90_00170 [Staphylococcus felis]PNZ38126.1 hypothetical protein CD143_00730 [Staphylococcus felis]QQB02435.1 DNA-directed RNA polymerase subunit beta [Staphylococcus felis]REH74734.1 DNA-directed RNA polymerase subunit beta [Staphylococcus felis]REH78289.1 DNA-directed RNA polymerase subunit beta [Staphylococcus felis]
MRSKGLNPLFNFFSVKVILFFVLCILVVMIGILIGFIINHDNILNAFDLKFWQHLYNLIGGS